MIELNPFAISGLLIIITYLPLFIFVLNGKTWLSTIYSFHILSVLYWGAFSFIISSFQERETAEFIWRLSNIGVYLIPVFFLHAVNILTKNTKKPLILYAYIQSILIIGVTLSGGAYTETPYLFNSFFYPVGNYYYLAGFTNWVIICSIAHIRLIKYYRTNFPHEKQLIALLYISILGFLGGVCNFLPCFRIELYPYGNFLVPLHSMVITYAILKYQFLNIYLVFKKSLVYSILFATVSLIYLLIVVLLEKVVQNYFGYTSSVISVVTAFFIGILFIPLRNQIQNILDHILFQTSHIEMFDENERLRQEIAQTEKLKTIAILASGMAHEVRNPLTVIKTFSEYLPQKLNDQNFLNKFVPLVNKEVERINELVQDLLEYAKPSSPILKPTDIHKIINDTLNILNSKILNKKITVIREFDEPNQCEPLLDSNQMKQVFLNIFINAIDALNNDGYLRITTNFDRHKLLIKITDTGCGITKEDLVHIFDPFFTKKENGTGLGLSITHGIIKEHSGKIFAESELGRGTTFKIELPIRKA